MKRLVTYVAALVAAATLFACLSPASAQAPVKMRGSSGAVRGHKSAASRGTNPNIKRLAPKSNPAGRVPIARAKRGGARGSGFLHFDNQTGLIIECFVDGNEVATIGGGGDYYDYEEGIHTMYAIAYFEDGSYLHWGPILVDAPYHLLLNP